MNIQIYKDADDLAAHAADMMIGAAREAIGARGRFTVALAGGSTPKATYAALARPERAGQMDWDKTFVFFGDERFARPDDENSNYGMARKSLLDHVPIPHGNVFPMPTESDANEDASAGQYVQTLAGFFGVPPHGLPPRLDLILLGLGDDGHTASLFPGAPTLAITDAWIAASPPGTLPPPVDRLTFTFPLINASRHVAFLVAGDAKAAIVREVLEGRRGREAHPAEGVQPADGTLTWLLDEAAASRMSKR
ncbi:MAG: 6-phosphogluconolactonase [Armatimonadetes bacterium]|nr:6-phosphogluconolactonase [Armatimonadota bacterium]